MLRGREVAESGHARLGDAIAALRPSWLQLAGDSVAADAVSRVAVFVNGRHQGDARVLYTIPADEVVSARLRTSEYVRRTDPRFPRDEFDVAIYVATRAQPVARRGGRLSLSLDAGVSLRGLSDVMDEAFTEAGYGSAIKEVPGTIFYFYSPGAAKTPSLGGTVRYDLRPWGVALTAHHAAQGWVGGYSYDADSVFSADLASTEGALLVTREIGRVSLGAGPAYRQVEWNWVSGFCQCRGEETLRTSTFGAAAEARFELPLRAPAFPAIRVLGRYYRSPDDVEYHGLKVNEGGFVLTMNLSVGTRF